MKRFPIAAGLALAGGAGAALALGYVLALKEQTIASRLSPDETVRARLVCRPFEEEWFGNPAIRLQHLSDGREVTIFRSPDAGGPRGTERLIWSKDGAWLLLVGRHFFVKDGLFLDNGDQAYFLHHLPTGRSWLNAADPVLPPIPPLQAELFRGIEFTEPVTLKGDGSAP